MQRKYIRNHRHEGELWKGLAAGLIGGLIASWTMNQFQAVLSKLSERRSQEKPKESGNSGNGQQKQAGSEKPEPATTIAALAISERLFHHKLTKGEKEVAGEVVHYGFGAVMGGLYGAVAEVAPGSTKAAGLAFGTVVWLVADEVAVPAFGLSRPPTKYPLSSHLQALMSHLVYGFTTDVVRRGILRAWGLPSQPSRTV